MDLKKRIGDYIAQLMAQYQLTYRMLSTVLGISPGRLSGYCKAKELPRADILIKLADIGGITVDDLLRTDKPPEHKEFMIAATGMSSVIPANSYIYKSGDMTDAQAAKVHDLAEEIVELERETSGKPKSLAAVYNAISKHFKVHYYRQIMETEFQKAESYLIRWKGKLKKAKAAPDKDILLRRKKRCSDILAITKKELGWTKKGLDNYIYEIYGVNSITDLEDSQLEHLYSKVSAMRG
ncbi:MAG: helix-turn-helix transcriptional regulator [Nitrospirae bacterium]|nr:helix-turn-helix transcriptional regulator [Nitrospirota bacterium]MBF0534067.1 helix-turn-helix transcriptional regulator [Nitrospirota bacterium]MBF0616226.1 helix-turn-helix transcriptional regulator [Nitrospirota bacterium]